MGRAEKAGTVLSGKQKAQDLIKMYTYLMKPPLRVKKTARFLSVITNDRTRRNYIS